VMVFAGLPGDLCAGINGVLLCGTMGYFRRNIYSDGKLDDNSLVNSLRVSTSGMNY
jgi:hypothetical protein